MKKNGFRLGFVSAFHHPFVKAGFCVTISRIFIVRRLFRQKVFGLEHLLKNRVLRDVSFGGENDDYRGNGDKNDGGNACDGDECLRVEAVIVPEPNPEDNEKLNDE